MINGQHKVTFPIASGEDCMNVTVSTFNSNQRDYLASAKTMKAKLKLPDELLQALCQNEMPRRRENKLCSLSEIIS